MLNEMTGMETGKVFEPKRWSELTHQERKSGLRAIIFMKQKRCGKIKTRLCVDGRPHRHIYTKEDSTSPTVKTESVIITAVIDAKEDRFIAIADITQAFLKAMLPDDTYVKLEGVLDNKMIEINHENIKHM